MNTGFDLRIYQNKHNELLKQAEMRRLEKSIRPNRKPLFELGELTGLLETAMGTIACKVTKLSAGY